MEFIIAIVCAYLYGSIPTGYLAGKLRGRDIRCEGSGSTGATNVLRLLGVKSAVIVAMLDASKGVLLVFLSRYILEADDFYLLALVFSAALGHVFPLFLGFKGGKGVAVLFGGVLIIAWHPVIILIAVTWVAMLAFFRIMSLANLITFLFFVPLGLYISHDSLFVWYLTGLGLFLFVLFTHRENVYRIIKRTEKRLF